MKYHLIASIKDQLLKHSTLLTLLALILSIFSLIFLGGTAYADSININLGDTGSFSSKIVQVLATLTVLSIAPSILIMVTSFTRIIIVFSFLRSALGLQQSPPNSVLSSLALFLTFFIMQPVFNQSYEQGIKPFMDEKISFDKAYKPITEPFKAFMLKNVREKDLKLFTDIAKIEPKTPEDIDFHVVIPAFMISEIRRAFEIGFLIFIPFLVIDMMVSSTLMAMGMMMLPPVMISLPFKIIFFVLIDGWNMLVGSLVKSFGV